MPLEVRYRHASDHVLVTFAGTGTIEDFLAALQEVGADSVAWPGSHVIVDLRGVGSTYTFTEQLRIGEAVGRNLGHLSRVAAVVPPERITRVGEKVANRSGARAAVFATEAEALAWMREGGAR
jgi:hypothetical protein